MISNWLAIAEIPNAGANYSIQGQNEQSIWQKPINEFHLPYQIAEPIKADIFVQPQTDGCYIKGKLTGKIITSCTRCTENAVLNLNHSFECLEPFPLGLKIKAQEQESVPLDPDFDDEVMRLTPDGYGSEINIPALLWEEFLLAMPNKALCKKGCKGLCQECGKNLNTEDCACKNETGDPRLVALKNLKILK